MGVNKAQIDPIQLFSRLAFAQESWMNNATLLNASKDIRNVVQYYLRGSTTSSICTGSFSITLHCRWFGSGST